MSTWHSAWLIPPELLLGALVASAIVSALFGLLVVKSGPVDIPRERGSHRVPTPTSGGLAIMAGSSLIIGLVLAFFGHSIPGNWRDGAILFGFASLMGLSGALDDLIDLPPKLRLGFQIAMCLGFAWFYRVTNLDFGPGMTVNIWPPLSLLGSAAWLVLGINTLNFMDGSNGLALGTQAIAMLVFSGVILWLAGSVPLGSCLGVILLIFVCVGGAHLGFTPLNMPMGKVFQGDAGALFGGAMITGGTLVLKVYGVSSAWFGGFLLAPLLVDVVLTLFMRASQGKDVLRPHKEHLYQLWLQRADPSHGRLALRIWGLCAFSAAVGLTARVLDHKYDLDMRFLVLVIIITGYSFGWLHIRKSLLNRPPLSARP